MDTTQGMVPAGDAGEKQAGSAVDLQRLAEELVERARAQGLNLVGPGVLLAGVTKQVVETALETEMAEHLGYEPHDPAGRNTGNSRNGRSEKTLQTDIGPVRVAVPRDRNGTFEPQLVAKGQLVSAGLMRRSSRCSPRASRPVRFRRICWRSTARTSPAS